ncbi:MAG: hypothetical protein IPJ34_26400 [Myxococcales bacterium]|nr:hypothetical protein [Myxococcales bacterium]
MKRTVADWARLADEAADERTLTQALDRAGELAQTCHDLRVVLRSASAREEVPPAKLAAIADRTLEAATRDREVWGFRDAAVVRAGRLADRAGARAALELGEATLRAPRTDALGLAALSLGLPNAARAYEWILLGEGHRQILGDEPAQRRCLAQARADATEYGLGGELCDVASAYVGSATPRSAGSSSRRPRSAPNLPSPGRWRTRGARRLGPTRRPACSRRPSVARRRSRMRCA